jgi:hypothetical protein
MRPQTKGLKPQVIQIDRDEKGASTASEHDRSASILGGGLPSGGGQGALLQVKCLPFLRVRIFLKPPRDPSPSYSTGPSQCGK